MKKKIIKIIKSFINHFGIDIIKFHKKSIKTDRLSFYKTLTGNYWLPKDAHSDCIANSIKGDRIFDEPIYQIAKKYIKPNTTVLDIGSNFGQMAVLMSKLVGEKDITHAFEADEFIFNILEKNTKENSKNIITHFGAVHNKSNEILHFPEQDFKRFNAYGSYGIDYKNNNSRPVNTLTVDELTFELPISFIKVDIQGGDLFAMKGAINTINKYKPAIIFEYEYAFEEELNLSFQEYVDFVKSINYHFEKVLMGHNFLILPN